MRALPKPLVDPGRKARLSKMRKAGHAWGALEANKAILALGENLTTEKADRWIARVLIDRQAALQPIGADDADITALKSSCWKNYLSKLSAADAKP